MNQEPISYIDVINLGFKSEPMDDNVFLNEYGFTYCLVYKDLADNIRAEWDILTRTCDLIRHGNEMIKGKLSIKDLSELTDVVNFFTKDKNGE